jgi:MFS family permease
MALGLVVAALGNALVPLIGSAGLLAMAMLVAQQVIGDGGHALHAVHERTLRQTVVAPAMLARVDGGLRTLGQLATLFGALAGGAIGDRFGARSVLALGPLLLLAAALWCWRRLGGQALVSPADFPQ